MTNVRRRASGWVAGRQATFCSLPTDTIDRHSGEPDLQFLDYRGQVVPW